MSFVVKIFTPTIRVIDGRVFEFARIPVAGDEFGLSERVLRVKRVRLYAMAGPMSNWVAASIWAEHIGWLKEEERLLHPRRRCAGS